ncbi:MAG: response regulator transcription factor [Caldilineaceae bacterium]|nr:response regulator transcription factor [Caldilineaceae bacterium]
MQERLLIIDDDDHIRTSLQEYFIREGFDVTTATDGAEALDLISVSPPQVIILDVVLPKLDGLEVCREVRRRVGQDIGIIMFSAPKQADPDQEVGLMVGADVYMPKPVQTRVLLAQVKALLRRLKTKETINADNGWFVIDEHLRIHFKQQKVIADGKEVTLTSLEFNLLKHLIDHANEPCTQADLMDEVWGYEVAIGPAAVTTCIAKLRAKIEPASTETRYIVTKHKVGYYFKLPEG